LLAEQASRLEPAAIVIGDAAAIGEVRAGAPSTASVASGEEALLAVAVREDVDLVIVGTSGVVSLRPVLAALEAGKVVATANKETLVAGGHLVMPLAAARAAERHATDPGDALATTLGWLRPIDSEHSAIWQSLVGEDPRAIDRLILTASGGPFLDLPAEDFPSITPDRALRHPTWHMGAKVTIDSATLANKGLEVIEARWLYDVPYEQSDVVSHPQSVVHSAVQFVDGSLKAQLGTPDMRLPIQYALTYPDRRRSRATAADLVATARLDFRAPDEHRFPALRIARDAGRIGPRATAALIAADDIAVARFLGGSLDFPGIPRMLEDAVTRFGAAASRNAGTGPDLEELIALDGEVRATFGTSSARAGADA
jgi:1-deoxy-D-xylulose-5-phosphate reductoisomerase